MLTGATLVGDSVELAGFVAGVLADGATCRFELVTADGVLTATSTSQADATTTVCPTVTISAPGDDPAGWTARLVWVPTGASSAALPVEVG